MRIKLISALFQASLVGLPSMALSQAAFTCSGDRVCQFDQTRLPVRIVVRPVSALYTEADDMSEVKISNLPAFRPWYVFESVNVDYSDPDNPAGFFQVGVTRDDTPRGWVAARDAIVWNSNIVVTYAPRGFSEEDKRSRVVMFETLDAAKGLLESSKAEESSSEIFDAFASFDRGKLQRLGVVLAEPERELYYDKGAYIMPVIDHQSFFVGLDQTARYLQIAAAVPQTDDEVGRRTDDLLSKKALRELEIGDTSGLGQLNAAALEIDIVFAIDMTGSMQPYLDATSQAVSTIVGQIESLGLEEAVNYGLVGYTDIASQCNSCYFDVAQVLTPSLTNSGDIRKILDEKRWANDGGDWQETAFAGLRQAILETEWSENSLRYIFLIGDAVSREVGADGNPLNATAVRSLAANAAGDGQVQIYAIHPRPTDIPTSTNNAAAAQFQTVSALPGGQASLYYGFDVDRSNPDAVMTEFQTALQMAIEAWLPAIAAVRSGDAAAVDEILTEAKEAAEMVESGTADAGLIAKAGLAAPLVEYLGASAERPRDVVAWTSDIDPLSPEKRALEVRVLLDKRELSDLVATMEEIYKAYVAADLTGSDFFEEIQAGPLGATMDIGTDERDTARIARSGLAPRWIETLPYKSRLLTLSPDTFAAMDASQREDFEIDLEVKLEILKDYVNAPDIWLKLSPDVGELDSVFPVPIVDLP